MTTACRSRFAIIIAGSAFLLLPIGTALCPSAAFAANPPEHESFENSLGIKLVKIPAGEFLMGSHETKDELRKAFPQYEARRFERAIDDEYPAHRARITKPFYLAATAVTVRQFRRFVAETNYKTDAERNDPANDTPGDSRRSGPGGYGFNKETGKLDEHRNPKHTWRDTGFPQADDHPVVDVSWNDAVAFCKWLGEKERRKYRLPTEAEWEYACRAGTNTRYWCGDDPGLLLKVANIYDQASAKTFPEWSKYVLGGNDGFAFTAPVGSFRPNPFGLYDMHGNVWQWCSDFYGEDYYAHSPVDDPQGPPSGEQHVRRGGAWHSWALYCRSSFRNYNTPQSRYFNLGFRLALGDQ
jgi:formylglycine-generating enzyme required for sulfatase activity